MSVLRRATTTRVTDTAVWCTIPSLGGPDHEWGPLERAPFDIAVGDKVIVAQVSGERESFVVLAPLKDYTTNQRTVFYFEDEAARDAMFPGPNPLPTFVWIDDLAELQVWTDEGGAHWQAISWDDSIISIIESDINTLYAYAEDVQNRLTDLEGLAVSDTTTVDLALSPTWPKTLTADVKPNSIPLNDLSDVAVGATAVGQVIRHNGTSFVNSLSLLNDPSDVVINSPAARQVLRHSGSQWANDIADIHTCTSGTRPGSPITNQWIYETDTDLTYRWNGSAWKLVYPYNKDQVLLADTASVNFSSIPTTLRWLEIKWRAKSSNSSPDFSFLSMRVNGDSGTKYSSQHGQSTGTTHGAAHATSQNAGRIGLMLSSATNAGIYFATGNVYIHGWDVLALDALQWHYNGALITGLPGTSWEVSGGGVFAEEGPYSSVTLFPDSGNFKAGSQFTVKGWD